jgi:hypothetical protein
MLIADSRIRPSIPGSFIYRYSDASRSSACSRSRPQSHSPSAQCMIAMDIQTNASPRSRSYTIAYDRVTQPSFTTSALDAKRRLFTNIFTLSAIFFFSLKRVARAAAGGSVSLPSNTATSPIQGLIIWSIMFITSAILHSAESAITKISPWKVQQFAEEEGPKSPFATLSRNITRLLSTIVLTTTACSIYSTALFVTSVAQLFPALSLGTLTALLTVISILFGEVFPKALAVGNSELVSRKVSRQLIIS